MFVATKLIGGFMKHKKNWIILLLSLLFLLSCKDTGKIKENLVGPEITKPGVPNPDNPLPEDEHTDMPDLKDTPIDEKIIETLDIGQLADKEFVIQSGTVNHFQAGAEIGLAFDGKP